MPWEVSEKETRRGEAECTCNASVILFACFLYLEVVDLVCFVFHVQRAAVDIS